MIDIHIHILHGLDDGPADIDGSLAIARACVTAGTRMVVATPHIRDDYPFPIDAIDQQARELRAALADEGIPLDVLPGGEVSIDKCADLSDKELQRVCLARGPYVLVESPYGEASDLVETVLFDLQVRGFNPVLAHPERSPSFQADPSRLATLVERGVLASITAGSMEGLFGRTVQRSAIQMLGAGLVHSVASDAHDVRRRKPQLVPAFDVLDSELPGLRAASSWFTYDVPEAILLRQRVPEQPSLMRRRRRLPGLRARRQ